MGLLGITSRSGRLLEELIEPSGVGESNLRAMGVWEMKRISSMRRVKELV